MTETFLDLPRCEDFEPRAARAAILGLPGATPYPWSAVDCTAGPAAIRAAVGPYARDPEHFDMDFTGAVVEVPGSAVDCGDVAYDPDDPASNRRRITAATARILAAGAVPIALGGDDSVPIPFFQGFEGRGPFSVVQVDAHLDWRDEVRGERMGYSSNMRRASEMPWIAGMVQIGGRGVGSARMREHRDALAFGARLFPARGIAGRGVGPAVDALPPGRPAIVNIDLDGLDPAVMPAVSARAPGGLDYWHVVNLLYGIAERVPVAGIGTLTAARLATIALGIVLRQGGTGAVEADGSGSGPHGIASP